MSSSLKDKLSQSEHRVRAKESIIERMQQRLQVRTTRVHSYLLISHSCWHVEMLSTFLQSEVNKETLSKERQQEMFKQFHRRDPRSASAMDSKSMQLIHVYEAQLDSLRDENGFLKVGMCNALALLTSSRVLLIL